MSSSSFRAEACTSAKDVSRYTVDAAEVAKEQLYVYVGAAVDAGTSGSRCQRLMTHHDVTNGMQSHAME